MRNIELTTFDGDSESERRFVFLMITNDEKGADVCVIILRKREIACVGRMAVSGRVKTHSGSPYC